MGTMKIAGQLITTPVDSRTAGDLLADLLAAVRAMDRAADWLNRRNLWEMAGETEEEARAAYQQEEATYLQRAGVVHHLLVKGLLVEQTASSQEG